MISIGVDLMGSDTAAQDLLQAACQAGETLQGKARLVLIGTAEVLRGATKPRSTEPRLTKPRQPAAKRGIEYFEVSEVIEMGEDPLSAVRRKKDSSMRQGLALLREKKIDGFISAGNTGALILSAKLALPMLPGIERPALLTLLPTKNREMVVVDVGANISCKAKHLVQFAAMGIAYQKARGVSSPTVGLLNIGSEETKGTPELREAYQKLQKLIPHFLGNIEGSQVLSDGPDVLVTDGFSGNILLKTIEGFAAMMLERLQKERSPHHLIAHLRDWLSYAQHPGALVCGVEGIVVKCHGALSPTALINSIKGIVPLIQHSFLTRCRGKRDM